MAEKRDEPLTRRERLERLLDLAVELAELVNDQKTNSLLEGRMRMIAAGLRADAHRHAGDGLPLRHARSADRPGATIFGRLRLGRAIGTGAVSLGNA